MSVLSEEIPVDQLFSHVSVVSLLIDEHMEHWKKFRPGAMEPLIVLFVKRVEAAWSATTVENFDGDIWQKCAATLGSFPGGLAHELLQTISEQMLQ